MLSSEDFSLSADLTLSVRWAYRVVNIMDEYRQRCADNCGVAYFDYQDDNLQVAEAEMNRFMENAPTFIQRIYNFTGHLPVVGDRLQCSNEPFEFDNLVVRVTEREFFTPLREPDHVAIAFFVDTDQYDGYSELG